MDAEMLAHRVLTALVAIDDLYADNVSGPCVLVDGRWHCSLPEGKADLLHLLVDTALKDAHALLARVEGGE